MLLWDLKSGREIERYERYIEYAQSVVFSPDGTEIACNGVDGTVLLWSERSSFKDLDTDPLWRLGQVSEHIGFASVAYSPGGLLIAAAGTFSRRGNHRGIVFVWNTQTIFLNTQTLQQIWELEPSVSDVDCVSFSPDGHFLVSSGRFGDIEVWDVATGQVVLRIPQPPQFIVSSVEFSPYGSYIASGSESTLWDKPGELVLWSEEGMLVPHPFPPPWLLPKEFNEARW